MLQLLHVCSLPPPFSPPLCPFPRRDLHGICERKDGVFIFGQAGSTGVLLHVLRRLEWEILLVEMLCISRRETRQRKAREIPKYRGKKETDRMAA